MTQAWSNEAVETGLKAAAAKVKAKNDLGEAYRALGVDIPAPSSTVAPAQ